MREQVVLITGASSGIGEALARAYARNGASLVLVARRLDKLQALAAEIEGFGGKALAVAGDVTSDESMAQAVGQALAAYGRLDIVIANAGFAVLGRLARLTLDDYQRQFDTNVFGVLRTLLVTRAALVESRGQFVIIGSVNGFIGLPGVSPYVMSKFAVRGLAEALHNELGREGVGVTHIAPGFVESEIRLKDNRGELRPDGKDQVPGWLPVSAEAAAREILWAVQRRKAEHVVTGHGKVFVAIQRFFPRLTRFLVRRFGLQG